MTRKSNFYIFCSKLQGKYQGSTEEVPRKYRGSTEEVPRKYQGSTRDALLINKLHKNTHFHKNTRKSTENKQNALICIQTHIVYKKSLKSTKTLKNT